jgi:hypothetical protein
MFTKLRFSALIGAGVFLVTVAVHSQQDPMAEFTKQVNNYLAIHKKAAGSAPKVKVSEDPAEILQAQEGLAAEIRKLRPHAAQGDVFVPGVRPTFLDLINARLGGREGEAARKTVLGEGNPKAESVATPVELKVNASYPVKAPLSTVPPSLLTVLPTLPEQLEFRFVGRHLILKDVKANLIVDFLPNAVPEK